MIRRKIFISIQFRHERDAEKAVADLNTRWFDRKPIYAELRYEEFLIDDDD